MEALLHGMKAKLYLSDHFNYYLNKKYIKKNKAMSDVKILFRKLY